jgi:hypothetical protein
MTQYPISKGVLGRFVFSLPLFFPEPNGMTPSTEGSSVILQSCKVF